MFKIAIILVVVSFLAPLTKGTFLPGLMSLCGPLSTIFFILAFVSWIRRGARDRS